MQYMGGASFSYGNFISFGSCFLPHGKTPTPGVLLFVNEPRQSESDLHVSQPQKFALTLGYTFRRTPSKAVVSYHFTHVQSQPPLCSMRWQIDLRAVLKLNENPGLSCTWSLCA